MDKGEESETSDYNHTCKKVINSEFSLEREVNGRKNTEA